MKLPPGLQLGALPHNFPKVKGFPRFDGIRQVGAWFYYFFSHDDVRQGIQQSPELGS